MTAPETQWTIDQLGSVISAISEPLKRVDRDEGRLFDGDGSAPNLSSPIRSRTGDLQKANFVGVSFASRTQLAIGTEYDHDVEAVVGVRLEGLHHTEHGHIDPDGTDGIAWDGLKRRCRRAILGARQYPAAGDAHTNYTDATFQNETDNSDDWQDYYRADWDVVFSGYEELP